MFHHDSSKEGFNAKVHPKTKCFHFCPPTFYYDYHEPLTSYMLPQTSPQVTAIPPFILRNTYNPSFLGGTETLLLYVNLIFSRKEILIHTPQNLTNLIPKVVNWKCISGFVKHGHQTMGINLSNFRGVNLQDTWHVPCHSMRPPPARVAQTRRAQRLRRGGWKHDFVWHVTRVLLLPVYLNYYGSSFALRMLAFSSK